jgi:glycosyltransferase involved in cell wall biosynthesis
MFHDRQNLDFSYSTPFFLKPFFQKELSNYFHFQIMSFEELDNVLNIGKIPDIVVFHNTPTNHNISLIAKTSMFTKTIINEHNLVENFSSVDPEFYKMAMENAKLAFGYVTKVVAVSQYQRQWLISKSLVGDAHVDCIPQCPYLDDLLLLPIKNRSEKIVIGCFGRLVKQKGFDILIKSFVKLPDNKFELKIAGAGVEEEYLKSLAKGNKNIQFIGHVHNLSEFLKDIDIVVIPSIWEAWGNVCVEAKAAGKIVIASDTGGLTEQLEKYGFLFPPQDVNALINQIKNVIALSDWSNLTLQNRADVNYSWQSYISSWKDEFESLLY